MVTALAWPVVVLLALVVLRQPLRTLLGRLENVETPVVSASFAKADEVAADISGALAGVPAPEPESAPSNMAHLMPLAATRPRDAIRAAFRQVRRALAARLPGLPSSDTELTDALSDAVLDGRLPNEVAWAVTQLRELLDQYLSSSEPVSPGQAYQFLALAEGAIHAIARSVESAAPTSGGPLPPRWAGTYNDDYPIELMINSWQGGEFTATMIYPESDTRTRAKGRVVSAADTGLEIAWTEDGYIKQGRRTVSFEGTYRALVIGGTMTGSWNRAGGQRVANFRLTASPTTS